MLHKKVELASQEAKRSSYLGFLKPFLIFGGGIVALVAITVLWPQEREIVQNNLAPTKQLAPTKPPAPTKQKVADAPIPENTQDREAFKVLLGRFGEELQPAIASDLFKSWNENVQHEVLSSKQQAVSSFGNGEYSAALTTLRTAVRLSEESLAARKKLFESELQKAKRFLGRDDYDSAKLHITRALKIDPAAEPAITVNNQIAALPKFLTAIKAADVARAENNVQAELINLRKAVQLAPQRSALAARLASVEFRVKEQTFSGQIDKGIQAIARRDLASAKSSLSKARRLFSNRDEVSFLAGEVARLGKQLAVQRLYQSAAVAEERDDWDKAQNLYAQALKIKPEGGELATRLRTAKRIISLKQVIARHVQRSKRLASQNVADTASRTLVDAKGYLAKSKSLTALSGDLNKLLKLYATEVSVIVSSDNLTHISVRGVGVVGVTGGRTIKLRPGEYRFEGKREGYKSKLVRVSVPPGATRVQVEVVCNEQL
jgi:tetratricopeptide (TPR) repeat protein